MASQKEYIEKMAEQLFKESESEIAQSCPALCDPMDCGLPDSSIHGIFQATVLEWVTISFSRGSSQPRDRTQVSRIAGRRFTLWANGQIFLKAGERYGISGTLKHNTPYKFDQQETSLRHITIKLFKIKDKVRILNSAREKKNETKTLFHTMESQTAINRFFRQNFADQETVGWYIQSAKWKTKKKPQLAN